LKAIGRQGAIVVDIDDGKREAAKQARRARDRRWRSPTALEQLTQKAGGADPRWLSRSRRAKRRRPRNWLIA